MIGSIGLPAANSVELDSNSSFVKRNQEAGVPWKLVETPREREGESKVISLEVPHSSGSVMIEAQIAPRSLSDALNRDDDGIEVSEDVN